MNTDLLKPEMMQTLFMENSDAVAVISRQQPLIANRAFLQLFLYDSPEQISALNPEELIAPGERESFSEYLDSLTGCNENSGDLKIRGRKKDGTLFPMEISITAINCGDREEAPLYIVAARDNRGNLAMKEELERSRRSLLMIKNCHKILLGEDREEPFLDKICQMIGSTCYYDLTWYTLKKEDGSLATGSFDNNGKRQIGSVRSLHFSKLSMKEKRTILCDNLESRKNDGVEWEEILAGGYRSLITIPLVLNEQTVGTMNICSQETDVFEQDRENLENLVQEICYGINKIRLTERQKQLERQLLQAQKMETIGTLAGGIAHDFNNIMTPIMGYSEMILARMPPEDPLYKYNEQILNGAIRARELVKQILTFSHKEDHNKEPVYLDRIVREALHLVSSLIPSTISIRKHLAGHCGKILADPSQIHQVIVNLCTNSFHAMEEKGGDLIIELKKTVVDMDMKKRYPELKMGEYLELVIGDTGHGMNRETRNRIFEPFFTTKPVGKGTGLGLSVVHGIIKNHRGLITVESEPDQGTIFRIFLPQYNQEMDTGGIILDSRPGSKTRIMILDDQHDITEVLKIILISYGYGVESFNDAEKALEAFNKDGRSYSLVVTDLHMPGMDGLDFIREIHKMNPRLPSLLITGYSEEISEKEKRSYNIKKILRKPILHKDFLEAVSHALTDEPV